MLYYILYLIVLYYTPIDHAILLYTVIYLIKLNYATILYLKYNHTMLDYSR